MAEVTVEKLADVVGAPVDRLLKQMEEAGLPHKAATDAVSDDEKQRLLAFLKRSHGESDEAPKKITLKRKVTTTLKAGNTGRSGKTVNVEVRKKRTYVKRSAIEAKANAERLEEVVAREEEERLLAEEQAVKKAAEEVARLEQERLAQEQADRKEAEKQARKQEVVDRLEAQKAKMTDSAGTTEEAVDAKPVAGTAEQSEEVIHELTEHERERLEKEERKEAQKEKKGKKTVKPKAERNWTEQVNDAYEEDIIHETKKSFKRLSSEQKIAKPTSFLRKHGFSKPATPVLKEVQLPESIQVAELARRMSVKVNDLIKTLMKRGVMASLNQDIERDTAILVVEEMGHQYRIEDAKDAEEQLMEVPESADKGESRAPVVTVMGHVDHGKTSLLDYIRETKVTAGESGGITQHIGAYHVETDHGMVTFLDTPGHAAFTAMRARGAKATDIVILVVAADDGVMPQTEEAIQHARAAGVPIVVAVNKMDKEAADPERVKSELAAKDVIPEDWGGDTQFVKVSAHTGQGIDELLDAVLLQAEMLELKAPASGRARGVVVEARLDKGRGAVATLLVQSGTLNVGDIVLAGQEFGRARALLDENGNKVKSAGPSIPVEILGLGGAPGAGDEFIVVENERRAREVAELRLEKMRADEQRQRSAVQLENLFANMGDGEKGNLNILLKTDVRGSLEALSAALEKLGNDEVGVTIVSRGVGGISETDANLAVSTNAVIIGFNVRADATARKIIEKNGIDLRYYSVIYDIVDDVKAALSGMLAPEYKESILGVAEVRDIFNSPKFGSIAGSMVIEGVIHRNKPIRVLRDDVVIYEGELESLRRFKDDVSEVRNGMECGIGVKNYTDVRVGDKIEVFDLVQVERSL